MRFRNAAYIAISFVTAICAAACGLDLSPTGSPASSPTSPQPVAISLTATPSVITQGQSVSLSWSATNATSCGASWTPNTGTAGSVLVAPIATTTYAIACAGPGGTSSALATVTVASNAFGSLVVAISGLPAGVAGNVSITGPDNYQTRVSFTSTLQGLTPGAFTVGAAAVMSAGVTYMPQPPSQQVVVAANASSTIGVRYSATPLAGGTLDIAIVGLPSGAAGSVTVSGANGFSRQVTASQTMSDLAPGLYTIAAANVTYQGAAYSASPQSQQTTVGANATTQASVVYSKMAAPSVSLSASPASIVTGQTSTLTWTSSGATSCSAPWTSSASLLGTQTVAPVVTSSYSIVCTGTGGSTSATASVTVTAAATIGLSVTSLSFIAAQDAGLLPGPLPDAKTASISSAGTGSLLNLNTTVITQTGGNWLAVSLSSTAAPATLTARPTTRNLAPGVYSASVLISGSPAANSPQQVMVTYTVTRP